MLKCMLSFTKCLGCSTLKYHFMYTFLRFVCFKIQDLMVCVGYLGIVGNYIHRIIWIK